MSLPNCRHPFLNEWPLLVCHIILREAVSCRVAESLPFCGSKLFKAIREKVLGDGVAVLQHKKGNNKSKNNVHFLKNWPSL